MTPHRSRQRLDMIHFPVTTSFWKGVWGTQPLRRPMRRACDWQLERPENTSFRGPLTCNDCAAYRAALIRMRVIRP